MKHMKSKKLNSLSTLVLVLLPFFLGGLLGKHSPYREPNPIMTYILIWSIFTIVFTLIVLKFSANKMAISLLLLACPIVGIVGMLAPPDLSMTMLDHPEREHLRYFFLFMGAFLFSVFFILHVKSYAIRIDKLTKFIMTSIFLIAFIELLWEFTHHYLYPEALARWIAEGKKFEDFNKSYDNVSVINAGVLGRLLQFSLISWLSVQLYQMGQSKLWSPILIILISLLGIASAVVTYFTEMHYPKGLEFLFLFFIPGMPFLLLYWMGVAMVIKPNEK